ncbi:MAG TPA: HIRAN domain-containing protein, partial [Phycisphaerae bacterium]|nr:HIRAN domain-containing protein [Phycisphaerae bacterium]
MGKKRESQEELLGKLVTEVVGLQHYTARIGVGEGHFEREPDNAHDHNAIRVENVWFEAVGH